MVVCEHCFSYLESREGRMAHKNVESLEEILKDPEFPRKLVANEDEEIVRCEWCEKEFEATELIII